jgi:thiol reductant ABC exporter CydD subunit
VLALVALLAALILIARGVDAVFVGGRGSAQVLPVALAVVALGALRALAQWGAARSAGTASARIRSSLRIRLLDAVARPVRSAGTDERRRSGDLLGVVGDSVDALDDYVTRFVPAAALAVFGPAIVFVVVVLLDPLSSLVLVFAGPMLVLLLAVIGHRTRELTRVRLAELSWLHGFFLDLLRGLGALSVTNRAEDAGERIEEVSRRHGATTMEVLRTAFQTSLVLEWSATAATALVAVTVSFRMIGGGLGFAVALSTLVVVPEFFGPLRRLAVEYHAGQSGQAAWERIGPWLDDGPRSAVTGAGAVGPEVRGVAPLEFVGVTVRRDPEGAPTIDDVTFRIDPGETVALVGPSGAGKSTVVALVLGFLAPDSGMVRAAGVDLGEVDVAEWRRHLAWVPQSPTVFAGTVADNVRLGVDADDDRVRAALHAAGAMEFVDGLHDGINTVLAEEGTTISGGQRQRLAIARAWVRDAPLVVLDEFTAHLDLVTEEQVLAAAEALLDGRTALLVAHRLQTARLADRIVVLDGGRVVGSGTHDELLATCGTYRSLVEGRRDGLLAESGSDPR